MVMFLNSTLSYKLGRRWDLNAGLGLNYAHSTTLISTKTIYPGSSSATKTEDIRYRYILLEAPLYFRWHLFPKNNPESKVHLFFDLGIVYHFPLSNNSSYEKTGNYPELNDLALRDTPSAYLGAGLVVSERLSISIAANGLYTQQGYPTNANMIRLMIGRKFFINKP